KVSQLNRLRWCFSCSPFCNSDYSGTRTLIAIMGLRRTPRTKMVAPIRVWGSDSTGKIFNILAHTLDVSTSGARIGGVKVPLGVGDAVTVQYKQQKGLYKVVW